MFRSKYVITPLTLIALAVLACSIPGAGGKPVAPTLPAIAPTAAEAVASPTPLEPSATPTPGPYGPTGFPDNVNPLTGLAVADPAVLNRRPLLIKVSNESPTVRPQSGLSFADNVWEYQMEGYALTRYTAVFLSQTPERVGSVRSARLIDVANLVDMYGGVLVYSGGSTNHHNPAEPPRVNELINAQPWAARVVTQDYIPAVGAAYDAPYFARLDYPSADIPEYHKLFAFPDQIWNLITEKGLNQKPNLDGLVFSVTPPGGGAATTSMGIDYPGKGPKHTWTFDAGSNRWLSSTEDQQSGLPDTPDQDLITGQQLAFDNIVIVHAFHANANFLEDEKANLFSVWINLYDGGDCTLLRDGQRFTCTWKRADKSGMMQFFDASGANIAFKPGTTWFNVAVSNIPTAVPEITFAP